MPAYVPTPQGVDPAMLLGRFLTGTVRSHDFGTGSTELALTHDVLQAGIIVLSGTGVAGVDAVVASDVAKSYPGKPLIVRNASAQAVTFKGSGKTGVAVAAGKTAVLFFLTDDFVRVTADA